MAKIYKGIPYTGTLPAVLTGTKAGNLHRYKIYGNMEQSGTPTPENPVEPAECGERTENLFDPAKSEMGCYYDASGARKANSAHNTSDYIPIESGKTYALSLSQVATSYLIFINLWDANKQFVANLLNLRNPDGSYSFSPQINGYIRFNWLPDYTSKEMLTEGSTAPTSYIPYGYKLPLLSGSTPVDIYIGDDTLSTEEYVDSGTGKIYRMVSGVLTPTDPPVPFPAIPTAANSTTISWAGEGLAPSQFDSIAEWVSAVPKIYTNGVWENAQTYVYTNGEWVADTQ